MRSFGKITMLSAMLALAGAAGAQAPDSADASCGGSGCAVGADESTMSAVDQAADQAAIEEGAKRPIDVPFGKAWLGAADGDVTLVIFADYACSHCRDAQPVIDQLIAADPRLRVVYRIVINDPSGREAALTSLAVAQLPGASWSKFHRALDLGGDPTAATIAAALKQAGIEPRKLPNFDRDDPIDQRLSVEVNLNDQQIAEREATGVPAWVIGDGKALAGIELAKLQAAIATARAGNKASGK